MAAVKFEGNVKPRIKLPEEDDLLVSSQLQSFREQVQENVNDHGAEGVGVHDVSLLAQSTVSKPNHVP